MSRKVLVVFMSLIIIFLLIEGTLRLLGFTPARGQGDQCNSPDIYYWITDQYLGFRNKPHGSFYYHAIKGSPLSTTDRFGFRNGYTWSEEGTEPIVLFLGDSTVFCAEVPDDRTGPSEVAKLLKPQFDVRVLNAGVRGYSTVQSRRMLEECFRLFRNVKVVVYIYFLNDYAHNLNPLFYYPAPSPAVWWDDMDLVFIEPPPTSQTWGESVFQSQQHVKQRIVNDLLQSFQGFSAFFHFLYVRSLKLMKGQNIKAVPQQTNRQNIVDALPAGCIGATGSEISDHEMTRWAKQNGADRAFRLLVSQMDQLCREQGAVFLATAFTKGKVKGKIAGGDRSAAPGLNSGVRAKALLKNSGIHYIELERSFTRNPGDYAAPRIDGDFDPHYGLLGTKTFAEALSPTLLEILSRILNQDKQ